MQEPMYHLMRMRAGNVIAIRTEAPVFCIARNDVDEVRKVADMLVARIQQKAA